MFVIFYTKVFLRYNLSLVLTTTAAMLFVFGTGGVLEMVHQGGLANYQISRCLTYVDEQSISFFDNFRKFTQGKKNRQRLLYVHVGMRYDLSGNGIRCEFFPSSGQHCVQADLHNHSLFYYISRSRFYASWLKIADE